ncbi:phage antirepressor KilAC domain-containing protein [Nitrosomonas marina]|uniref:Phage regulatory protein Rha n=1 Tax=Nitrosomonas marina TaxID=917 RepID=A0A1H8IS49_9PROT|nr:phage regulatory protein/antirepressor Ant [Nitrosomonas marina]SEN71232.1 Phage regulatory protein Rha [Nitrosomonas marina]
MSTSAQRMNGTDSVDSPMSIVTITGDQPVTTTLAIAQGTKVEHKAVIQLVRNYLSDLEEFGRVEFKMSPFETAGGTQRREIAILNEQQATLLLTYMRNSDIAREFKKRLVKAFWEMAQKLRSKDRNPANLSRLQLIEMAMEAEKERIALEHKVEELKEDSEALNRISKAEGSLCITDAAKTLQIRPKNLFTWLQRHGWIYKRIGCAHYCAYQDKLNRGLMEHKSTTVLRSDGTEKVTPQARVTPEGLEKLAKLLPPEITEVAVNE